MKVIIIGGGLAGSTLANGLAKHNIDFAVYDREPRHSSRDAGYQIRLGENALIGMRTCLEKPELLSIVKKFGHAAARHSDAPIIYDTLFRELLDLGSLPTYSTSANINRNVLRDALNEPLHRAGRLHDEKKFVRYEIVDEKGSERVRAWFDDGTFDDCHVLIGADGNQSKVNYQLGLRNVELLTSHVLVLTKCNVPESAYRELSPELRKSPTLATFAANAGLYFSVYLPNQPQAKDEEQLASCMLGLTLPAAMLPEDVTSLSTDETWSVVDEVYKGWSSKHHEILRLLRGKAVYTFWPRVGRQPPLDWRAAVRKSDPDPCRGHPAVFLMGDAIHPMLPMRGMGGNQAMRDSADLLPLLVELARKAESVPGLARLDIEDACVRYEKAMIPRAFAWVKKSGNTNPMIVDVARNLDWAVLFVLGCAMPVLQLGYKLLSRLTNANTLDDAPEFAEVAAMH